MIAEGSRCWVREPGFTHWQAAVVMSIVAGKYAIVKTLSGRTSTVLLADLRETLAEVSRTLT